MMEKLEKLTRLISDGNHNAFTSMVRFRGALYLSWRRSSGHAEQDGAIAAMRSFDDGQTWEELTTPFSGKLNYYDGFLHAFKDRLLLYTSGYEIDDKPVWFKSSRAYASESRDGVRWSEPVEIQPSFPMHLWHPTNIGEYIYVAAYRIFRSGFQPWTWEVDLLRSQDGFKWELVSELQRGGTGNEAALLEDDGKLYAFIRNEGGSGHLTLREAEAPYKQWSAETDFHASLQGPVVAKVNGRRFLFGRYRAASPRLGSSYIDRGGTFMRCYVWVEELQLWAEYLSFPSGADCSYPAVVALDDQRMLVSYYSQHDYLDQEGFKDMSGAADIYLAVVRTDALPEWGRVTSQTRAKLEGLGLL
ncbi:MAG: exo-alpha-sialidase [Oligosphaeraceae bacterium]|nr:exo-alpha-sialidase [Oligosphaeraceae bacterium]